MPEPVGTPRVIRNSDYPSNAIKTEKEKPAEERVKKEKVVKGKVLKRKKTLGKKIAETFLGDTGKSVKEFLVHDVAVPSIKNFICDIVGWNGFMERLLFGTTNGRRVNNPARPGQNGYVNYSGITRQVGNIVVSGVQGGGRGPVQNTINNRAVHNFDDMVFVNRGDADEVLGNLVDAVMDFGQATVADLYDFAGIDSVFTDHKYGWRDLSMASISRVKNGWLLNLPRTEVLN